MVEKVNSSDYEQYTTGVMPDGWTINEGDVIDIPGFDYDTMNTRTRTLYYTRNSYTLSFGNCTGVGDATLKYEEVLSNGRPSDRSVQPPAGVDSDYTFGGWYTSPACEDGTEVNWDSTMPSKNLQVYAKWVAPTYTVNFVTTKDNLAYDSITVTKYETIGEIPTPEIEGNEFLGWYVDADCTEPFIATRQIPDDFTRYATWKRT